LRGGGCGLYALVIFEGLVAKSLLVFDHVRMAELGRALGKRHPDQENTLQMGQANYRAMTGNPGRFHDLGVQVVDLQFTEGPG
jgi:hypothetical protein